MSEASSGPRGRGTVVLLTTGGTIASAADESGALVTALTGQELVDRLRATGLHTAAVELQVEEVCCRPSPEMDVERMLLLAGRVRHHAARPEVVGVVVTHGTDTMEESAFLVDQVYAGHEPVVFTGAQRVDGEEGFDGFTNLADAVAVACSSTARGRGVLIVMGGVAVVARGARKVHTTDLRPFAAPDQASVAGLLAGSDGLPERVADANVAAVLTPVPATVPRAAFVTLVAGQRACTLRAVVQAEEARALVIAGFGMGAGDAGHLGQVESLVREGVLVVMSSRCDAGPVTQRYGQGGSSDMAAAGAVVVGGLPGPQLRIAASLALAASATSAAGPQPRDVLRRLCHR